jgi:hypothetical protein
MKIELTLTSDQVDEIALQSLKDAKKNLYYTGTEKLMFQNDKELEQALTLVISHYTA